MSYHKLFKSKKSNGKRIAIDGGHGANTAGKRTPYIKSLGRQIREHEFNDPVSHLLKDELLRAGFEVLLLAIGDYDMPLQQRTNLANKYKCDAYISIHFNAYDGSFSGPNPSGIELYVYPGYRNKDAGKLAESIAKHLKQGTKQKFRGIKEADFHVLRETNMSAVLTENGFMDHPDEALLMLDKDFQKEVAVEHAKGICEHFGVKYVPEPKPKVTEGTFYRVVTGSFKNRENAERRVKELEKAGFDSFIDVFKK